MKLSRLMVVLTAVNLAILLLVANGEGELRFVALSVQ